jgi:hypothetical protein
MGVFLEVMSASEVERITELVLRLLDVLGSIASNFRYLGSKG